MQTPTEGMEWDVWPSEQEPRRILLYKGGNCLGKIEVRRMSPPYEQYYFTFASNAVKGYGPLLYDKAIEVVSRLGCKLVNHATKEHIEKANLPGSATSPSATVVWNKYKEREDVQKHDLGGDFHALSKKPNQKYFYEK